MFCQANDLVSLFNAHFLPSCNAELVGGAEEPIYLPADESNQYDRIIFKHDYVSSALHEIAHWCIAGDERRAKVDYGYWYEPDGRSAAQQALFEKVEFEPQALEWIFSMAAGIKFTVSADNLTGSLVDNQVFKRHVLDAVKSRLDGCLSDRMAGFTDALIKRYQPGLTLVFSMFSLDDL